jgi:hypothetical protein
MSEDGQPGIDSSATTPDPTVTDTSANATPSPLVDHEGNLAEDWISRMPDDVQALAKTDGGYNLQSYKTFDGMVKSAVNAQKLVGKNTIAPLTENSTDEEKAAFWKAAGRPDTADDYNLQRPETFPEEYYSSELATKFQARAHELGLSQSQVEGLFEFNNSEVLSSLTQQAQAIEQAQAEADKALHAEWGPNYDANLRIANAAVEKGVRGDEDFKNQVLQKYGNDPDFIKFVSQIGSEFVESGVKIVPDTPGPSVEDIDTMIDEHMKSEAFTTRTHKGHQAALDRMSRLYEQKYRRQTG